MVNLLIIADDLTGASDTAVQFAKKGIRTLVSVNDNIEIGNIDPEIAVLAVDIASRHISPRDAAARAAKIVRHAKSCGVRNFYKKTDSTLRGNIGAELEAVMAAAKTDRLIFIPAYPKAERFTRNGYQYIGNDLVHTTALGGDPLEPLDESFVPSIIARQSDLETTVAFPRPAEANALLQSAKKGIIVFDCHSDEDLAVIGNTLATNAALQVTAGSAGFAELLPGLLDLPQRPQSITTNSQPLLVVNGSVNEIALRQIEFAIENGCVDIIVPPSVLLADEPEADDPVERLLQEAQCGSDCGKDVVLRTIARREELQQYVAYSNSKETNSSNVYLLAAKNMGRLVAGILERAKFENCVVFGGDTSIEVIRELGCSELLLKEEIMPGLALAELMGFRLPVNFITKSGGFGPKDVVLQIADFLRKGR